MRYQKVIRHGNALAVVIPAAVCRELEIHRGDAVVLQVLARSAMDQVPGSLYLEIYPVIYGSLLTQAHANN